MLVLSIGMAWFCFTLSPMTPITAFFSSSPGGLSELVLISAEVGADTLQVSLIHSIRIFFALGIMPLLCKRVAVWVERSYPDLCASRYVRKDVQKTDEQKTPKSKFHLFISIVVALGGGLLGFFSGIPSGALLFGMIFIVVFNLITNKAYLPKKVRYFTQICAGALIGSSITMANVMGIPIVLIPLMIILAGNLVMNLILGMLVFVFSKFDIHTALFSATPAGVSDMALMAEDLKGDGSKVALIHMFRLAATIAIFPQVYFWIIRSFLT